MFNIISLQSNAIKTVLRYCFTPTRLAIIKTREKKTVWARTRRNWSPPTLLAGTENGVAAVENIWHLL